MRSAVDLPTNVGIVTSEMKEGLQRCEIFPVVVSTFKNQKGYIFSMGPIWVYQ
jgi:hypothetical protein